MAFLPLMTPLHAVLAPLMTPLPAVFSPLMTPLHAGRLRVCI